MRPLGALAFAVLAALAVWLAIANRTIVTLSFDAFQPGAPLSSLAMPLFGVLLVGALIGLVAGGIYMAVAQGRLRRELRQERERAERLQRLLADETLARSAVPKAAHPAMLQRLAD